MWVRKPCAGLEREDCTPASTIAIFASARHCAGDGTRGRAEPYTLESCSCYLTSGFTELETVLASILGWKRANASAVASCVNHAPASGIRARLWLDVMRMASSTPTSPAWFMSCARHRSVERRCCHDWISLKASRGASSLWKRLRHAPAQEWSALPRWGITDARKPTVACRLEIRIQVVRLNRFVVCVHSYKARAFFRPVRVRVYDEHGNPSAPARHLPRLSWRFPLLPLEEEGR